MATVHFSQFTWDRESRSFIAELSDFGPTSPLEQIWPDSADLGLRFVGKVREIRFFVDREIRNDEGDLERLVLRPIPADARYAPGVSVILFND